MNHKKVANADLHELASLYALGALDAHEKMAFEEHVRQGCDTCSQEVRSFTGIVQLLGESVPVEPPRQMREQLLSRTSGRTQVPGILFEESGLLIALSDELAWQTFAPGIVY